jgi:hypothetical protein
MTEHRTFHNATSFARHLRRLHGIRRGSMQARRVTRGTRLRFSGAARAVILSKTGHRCHLCGGTISPEESWCADHVLAFSHGGAHHSDNYLPAHGLCNNYRWHYEPEEFQWIMKLGVWLRSKIEHGDREAMILAERFVRHEASRHGRRVGSNLQE